MRTTSMGWVLVYRCDRMNDKPERESVGNSSRNILLPYNLMLQVQSILYICMAAVDGVDMQLDRICT